MLVSTRAPGDFGISIFSDAELSERNPKDDREIQRERDREIIARHELEMTKRRARRAMRDGKGSFSKEIYGLGPETDLLEDLSPAYSMSIYDDEPAAPKPTSERDPAEVQAEREAAREAKHKARSVDLAGKQDEAVDHRRRIVRKLAAGESVGLSEDVGPDTTILSELGYATGEYDNPTDE